jgi:hypothetical protein
MDNPRIFSQRPRAREGSSSRSLPWRASVEGFAAAGAGIISRREDIIKTSMIKTSIPSPYDNGSDDEKGSIIPVKSYYPFGVAK